MIAYENKKGYDANPNHGHKLQQEVFICLEVKAGLV